MYYTVGNYQSYRSASLLISIPCMYGTTHHHAQLLCTLHIPESKTPARRPRRNGADTNDWRPTAARASWNDCHVRAMLPLRGTQVVPGILGERVLDRLGLSAIATVSRASTITVSNHHVAWHPHASEWLITVDAIRTVFRNNNIRN